jgi:hypothetical protein
MFETLLVTTTAKSVIVGDGKNGKQRVNGERPK